MKEQELALENLRHHILEEPGQADQALWTAVISGFSVLYRVRTSVLVYVKKIRGRRADCFP